MFSIIVAVLFVIKIYSNSVHSLPKNICSIWPFAQNSDYFYYLCIWQWGRYFVAALFKELASITTRKMWGLESRSRTSRSRSRLLWQSLGLVSKIDPGLGLGGYGLDYITVQYRDYTTDRLGVMAQKAEDMLLNEDNKWKIVQCATFSKSLNPRNIDKSVSDIRIRIRFPFENNFRISVCGCKPPILPDIQPANRIVILYAVREMVCFFCCEIKIYFFHEPRIHWKLGPGKSASNFHLTLLNMCYFILFWTNGCWTCSYSVQ